MRARNIKPGFYKNELLVQCDPLARILFSGLWCMADREGRLEDRPMRIKIEILPCDNCDTDALLQQLHNHKLIIRYSVAGEKYIQIPTFADHQKPHSREQASTIPPFNEQKEVPRHDPGSDKPALNPESPILNPESPSLRSGSSGAARLAPQEKESLTEQAKEKPKKLHGTRLSREWDLPEQWGKWAESEGMTREAIIRECDKFKDFWIAKAGPNATKLDWEATWRNWIRRHLEGKAA